jgi:hypothetical protein
MKKAIGFLIIVIGVCLLLILYFMHRQAKLERFCTGSFHFKFQKIEMSGAGRRATLTDTVSLDYLDALPKLGSLAAAGKLIAGPTYNTKFYDRFGLLGDLDIVFFENHQTVEMTYLRTPTAIERIFFTTLNTDAPPAIQQLVDFLVNETNRGKIWVDGHIFAR